MTRMPRFITLTMAFVGAALAQTAAPITVAAVETGSGQPSWSVTNTGTKTVTAFALTYPVPPPAGSNIAGATATTSYDAATEPLANKPVPPGQTLTLPYGPPNASVGHALPQVRAVIFADGASWGDTAWTGRLSQRRTYMRQSLAAGLADLNAAAADITTTRTGLINQFQSAQSAEQAAASDTDQRACIRSVRGVVLRNLQALNQAGVPIPIKDVIAHEMKALQARVAAMQANAAGQ